MWCALTPPLVGLLPILPVVHSHPELAAVLRKSGSEEFRVLTSAVIMHAYAPKEAAEVSLSGHSTLAVPCRGMHVCRISSKFVPQYGSLTSLLTVSAPDYQGNHSGSSGSCSADRMSSSHVSSSGEYGGWFAYEATKHHNRDAQRKTRQRQKVSCGWSLYRVEVRLGEIQQ